MKFKIIFTTLISLTLFSVNTSAQDRKYSTQAKTEIQQCEDGDASICYEVGVRYDNGDGVPQDYEKSAFLL